jgi:hypothetical protein
MIQAPGINHKIVYPPVLAVQCFIREAGGQKCLQVGATTLSIKILNITGLFVTLSIIDSINAIQHNRTCYAMDKLQLTGQNLGRVFYFRYGHVCAVHILC